MVDIEEQRRLTRALLNRFGRGFAEECGVRVTSNPASLLHLLCLSVLLALLGLSACRVGTYYRGGRVDESKLPAEIRGDYAIFATNCSKCHDLTRPLGARIDEPKHWDFYVARMARTAGSSISPQETPHILRFLYWHTEQLNAQRGKRP